jgi:predicted nucleic acid-binding Zn ribbon protein
MEPRCLVCGAPLDRFALMENTVRKSEVCSNECYEIYMTDDDGVCHADNDGTVTQVIGGK